MICSSLSVSVVSLVNSRLSATLKVPASKSGWTPRFPSIWEDGQLAGEQGYDGHLPRRQRGNRRKSLGGAVRHSLGRNVDAGAKPGL